MVYFGTGKYLDIGDDSFDSASIESFYGIHDNDQKVSVGKFVEQKILQEITNDIADLKSRVTSINEVLYPDKQGWFMKLLAPPGYSVGGERFVSQAILRENRLIFVTATPPRDECVWDGESWLMELNAIDGNRLNVIPIDLNNDKLFTDEDNVDYDGSSTIISGVQKASLGLYLESPAIIGHTAETEGKYVTGSGGDSVGMFRESSSRFSGRMSWRKLK